LSAANVHDSQVMLEVVDAITPIRCRQRGRPRKRPKKLHADKAYDSGDLRAALRQRGITPRIARRGIESSARLGRYRWVVERTGAWLCDNFASSIFIASSSVHFTAELSLRL
jgi:IS5 family transposase